jgi:hypothetical protein
MHGGGWTGRAASGILSTHYSVLGTRHAAFLRGLAVFLLAGAVGCGDARTPTATEPNPPPENGTLFDGTSAGTVTGRVVWRGERPVVPPLVERPGMTGPQFDKGNTLWPNPNAPVIGPATRAVRGAVVFLRGIDPRRGRPWDLPPVRVVLQGRQFHVRQGDDDGSIGFVRRGDAVEMVSADRVFHSLHAGGAAFFTLAFPDPDRPRTRRLTNRGVVEMTSAAGYFWMRGHLFVEDHPYYTRTDAEGRFRLPQVPPGRCEVVCWLPDWREERHERDPESSLVTRLFFRPPLESVRPVEVEAKKSPVVDFELAVP